MAPGQTAGTDVTLLPLLVVQQLVEAARNHSPRRHDVEDAEDPDLDHQLLELVDLGPAALLLDHVPNLEEADEARRQEGDAEQKVDQERHQEQAEEGGGVGDPDLADPGHVVPLHGGAGENGDRGEHGQDPGEAVVEGRVAGDGLRGPLEAGGEEPGGGQDDPPHARGQGEEVDEDKDRGAEDRGLGGP